MVLFQSVVLGLFGGVCLVSLYGLLRSDWPQLYTYNTSPLERTVRRTAFRYFIFRTVPPAAVFCAVAVTADRLRISTGLAVALCVLCFIVLSSFRAVIVALKHRARVFTTCAAQSAVCAWTVILGAAAFSLRKHLQGLIPEPSAFVEATWAVMFVAVAFYAYQNLARSNDPAPVDTIEMAKKDMGCTVWLYASCAARCKGVPPYLLLAIMVVESMQRPRWMRRLERFASRALLNRVEFSQGVTQEKSASTLSDREAIEITADFIDRNLANKEKELMVGGSDPHDFQYITNVYEVCRRVALLRNNDPQYADRVALHATALMEELGGSQGGV
ncbi:MAG: hypothetical protein Q3979_07255 [Actinomycetaceae bacterium]|nr:hypothetical protein [Actinomycetaceae bacterium]